MIQSSPLQPSSAPTAPPRRPRIVVISGSPRSGSRTLAVAHSLAERVADDLPTADIDIIDLADLSRVLFDDDGRVAAAARTAIAADLLIVASPVYKGSYTGLLKVFLDLLPGGALRGVTAVPLVLSAAPDHSFAAEAYLRPVLVELGAIVPARSFAVIEDQLPDLDIVVDSWVVSQAPALLASLARRIGAERAAPAAAASPAPAPRPVAVAPTVPPVATASVVAVASVTTVPLPGLVSVERAGVAPVRRAGLAEVSR